MDSSRRLTSCRLHRYRSHHVLSLRPTQPLLRQEKVRLKMSSCVTLISLTMMEEGMVVL
ncbi:hypothetical protein QJS04_geneDACA000545 [Acorus gramineus]|uniref:Uncharacterized protein n=1 Tax=Acorus gramineus TaxID=55184 RepID=A0AAV9ART6_ACOGR|nr:hypothetical protein QJS04_geneDACA000545 [Acorus gramineus]